MTLVGITFLFAMAEKNGSVDQLVHGAARLVGHHALAMPWLVFVVAAILTSVGALGPAAVAIIAPIALRFAAHHRINPLLMGLMTIHGAQAGGFSPISIYGGITNQVVERAGLVGDPTFLFLASLLFNAAIAIVIFFLFGGARLARAGGGAGDDVEPAMARSAADPALHRERLFTFIGLGALAVGALLFDLHIGFMAISVAAVLAIIAPRSQAGAVQSVSWPTILLICGIITYISVMEKVGTVAYVGHAITMISLPLIAALMLCYMGGVISAFASSVALLGIIIPLAVPFLAEGHVAMVPTVAAIAISTTIVDTSPFSTNGALVVANAEAETRNRVFRQLLAYSAVITLVGPLLAWAVLVLPSSL